KNSVSKNVSSINLINIKTVAKRRNNMQWFKLPPKIFFEKNSLPDQQNLENALSTFSGHMKNIAEMLRNVKRHTLVLLDEIGSGTE
uniref:MutS-related protein n=1 Tax=Enterococcus faecalis TaxID=1351 RepID=UPI001559BF0F